MHEIVTEIEIAAGAGDVWAVLTDFARYPEWNPFITRISGELREGARLEARMVPPGSGGMTFRPRVVALTPEAELRWLGSLGVPGIFDGEHAFRIQPAGPGRVRFIHSERFSGFLVPLLRRWLDGGTRQGFEAMNRALKQRAETAAAQPLAPA
jgi:hypothetical protein